MTARYAYSYFMRADGGRVRAVAPEHAAHRHALELEDYLGGPFEDRTGGLITFRATDAAQAERAVAAGPFVREGLLGSHWLKAWSAEGSVTRAPVT